MRRVLMVAMVAALLSSGSCGGRGDVHAKVCASTIKGKEAGVDVYIRLADSDCESGQPKARWRYYPENIDIAPVGGHLAVKTGSWDNPGGNLVRMPEGKTSNARKEFSR